MKNARQGQQELSMNATRPLHLQYKVIVGRPVASSIASSNSEGSRTQVVADVLLCGRQVEDTRSNRGT